MPALPVGDSAAEGIRRRRRRTALRRDRISVRHHPQRDPSENVTENGQGEQTQRDAPGTERQSLHPHFDLRAKIGGKLEQAGPRYPADDQDERG